MPEGSDRRTSRRFTMNLPLSVSVPGAEGALPRDGETRDVSFRGLYFIVDASLEPGTPIEFVLTLPKEITRAGDVHIKCIGRVIRVETQDSRRGVAARIERYEFVPTA